MRSIKYTTFKKHVTFVGEEDGKPLWRFEPGNLNNGLNFWDYDYLDPVTFSIKHPSLLIAVRHAAFVNGLRIIWNSKH